MEKVAITKCEVYEKEKVFNAVKSAIDLIGGIDKFIKKGQKVALKVNLLMKKMPEECCTTHPLVVWAVAKIVKDFGAIPFIVDSAGGPFNAVYMNAIYKSAGMTDVAKELEIEVNNNYDFVEVENKKAKIGFKFPILDALEKCDAIINLSKFKTHSFTGYTNCVKNMFGAIPGLTKVEMHGKYRDLNSFINFLYDIHSYFGDKIVLNITDAIWGMEGFGPSNGTPKKIGAVLAGKSAVCVDVCACKIVTINPHETPIIKIAVERGFIDNNLTLETVGENIDNILVKDFQKIVPNEYKPYANFVPKCLQKTVHKLMTKRPTIKKSQCKGCKKCFEHCPAKAISMVTVKNNEQQKADIDYTKCIRCYCCQELCPFGVVKVKSGIVYKIVHHKDTKRQGSKT